MDFVKMHGAGNDFIIINNMDGHIPENEYSSLALKYCTRKTSIGADGCMIVVRSDCADFRMVFYNSDGTLGEMCGNGARCIARYGYEYGLSGTTQTIEVTSGIVTGERITDMEYRIKLNDPSVLDLHRKVCIDGCTYDCGYVELGVPGLPHAVVEIPNWDSIPENELRELGRKLRFAPEFPKGANVNFVKVTGSNDVKAVTFERGVEDFTLACGTGCGSIATVLTQRGICDKGDVHIRMPGGLLTVALTSEGNSVRDIFLTGPTCIVCSGSTVD